MYKSHIKELVIVMGDRKNEVLAEAGLQALSAVCKVDEELAPTDP
jgi:sister-chromatid-cohesion protein PDS5